MVKKRSRSSTSTFASSGNWSGSYKNTIRTQHSSPRSYAKFKTWIKSLQGQDLKNLSSELEKSLRWTKRMKQGAKLSLIEARRSSRAHHPGHNAYNAKKTKQWKKSART